MKTPQLSTTEKIFHFARTAQGAFLNILFPPRCISCKKDGEYFCLSCRGRIPEENTIAIRGVISLWRYDHDMVREALLQLKYKGKRTLAKDLGASLHDKLLEAVAEDILYQNPLGTLSRTEKYLLIPIPIHSSRKKLRGYNQSELIAKEVAALSPEIFALETNVLKKTKETPSQVSVKNRQKRLENLRDSFTVVYEKNITGRTIIIIDDIVTTGATIAEARRTLLRSGAKRVLAATIAH